MHRLLKLSLSTSVFLMPVLAFAASDGVFKFIAMIKSLIEGLIPVVIGLAVLSFLWGVLQYVVAKDEDKQKEARGIMLYGIIALFVMVSVWGLVNILGDTLDLSNTAPDAPAIPSLP
jgi:fumarate reductase subunit D